LHATCDALGNPVRFSRTGEEGEDFTQALALIKDLPFTAVLADKGYDSDAIAEAILEQLAEVVMPSKKNRLQPREYDKTLYKERNLVERLFNRLKQFRGVATRYAKLGRNYLAAVYFASMHILLR
jgi:transposase